MKPAILSIILLTSAYGWTTPRRSLHQRSLVSVSTILKAKSESTNDPCWQDLSDDDCAMEKIYASHFVASEWIKSMPCASGLEVSVSRSFFSWHDMSALLCTSLSPSLVPFCRFCTDAGLRHASVFDSPWNSWGIKRRRIWCNGLLEFEASRITGRQIQQKIGKCRPLDFRYRYDTFGVCPFNFW